MVAEQEVLFCSGTNPFKRQSDQPQLHNEGRQRG